MVARNWKYMGIKPVWQTLLVVTVAALCVEHIVAYPYADDFPYQVHGRPVSVASASGGSGVKKLVSGSSKGASGEGGSDARDHRKEHAFDEAGSIGSASDAVRYHQLDNQLDGHRVLDASKGSTVDKVKHLAGENFEADKSHNRKHIKSGFSNSYHKDESGSKSSYYEDSDDHGGKQVYDNRHNQRNDYADKLYSQDRRNDYLRDHYDDRASGSELLGGHNYRRVGALDRGNAYGHRDGYAHNDHNDQHYGTSAYGGYDYYQPGANYHHYDDLYRRRSYYNPRPSFATAPLQPAPITIYEDPRDYAPYPAAPYPVREVRDGSSVLSRDAAADYHHHHHRPDQDESFGQRRRLIYRPSPAPLPMLNGYGRY
ncbi:uncharacterized protein LOC126562348 [Anopheles maculipalpis]|uniref:uncharacterized protein LOC126562348 n=1 Tax=Anopheles maculipalpis TaxID=1496333 RepID=UPI0021596238|nr:uncharacterized protein LOC126562348 [Anopheles maculipalpis]